ncbi:MAG: UDP-N-acetylmuramoyl-tripeptide--D-alanyl-D-alanine ligase [Muribaculaceae bacterium]|nr:UDP-N-acetylmuramoyl-tripeptide--D-alanyl-D-alanine ligase [Muribaculaceae bacterium]
MTTLFILILFWIIAAVAIFNVVLELKRDLMMLQQNSYRNERYMGWLRKSGDTTSVLRLCAYGALLFSLAWFGTEIFATLIILVITGINSYRLMTARYKKPLVMTARATRIFTTSIVLAALVVGLAVLWATFGLSARSGSTIAYIITVAALGVYCISHVILLCANYLLQPIEKSINRKYQREAERILASMPDLKIIGITGSYGKTSTKHYLHRILSEHFDTCMTPGSFNTTLGVIRTIREHLKPYNEVFIVEMGAKQRGDIKEIADLVHPTIGIVTAVGEQHLESFKTVENVANTKFELVDALPADGVAVINNDFEPIASRDVSAGKVIRYGISNPAGVSYTATSITYSADGTRFTISGPNGQSFELHTRLVGECNVSNLVAATIVALELGVPVEKIKYAVQNIEQVEHRLQVKRTPGGVTILDDAFNSNPTGSAMALDVLASMKGGRRIIITPGMIELGDRQEELNRAFGEKIATSADVAIIVGQYNRDAIVEGINAAGMDADAIKVVDSFNEAQTFLQSFIKPGDTVLYENDLPDTFK